ncbi:MAG: hypothetical protein HY319_13975 [Armatimonadetes bacterium]|nr:hypothetical protein [Armatimonadota bacterium]
MNVQQTSLSREALLAGVREVQARPHPCAEEIGSIADSFTRSLEAYPGDSVEQIRQNAAQAAETAHADSAKNRNLGFASAGVALLGLVGLAADVLPGPIGGTICALGIGGEMLFGVRMSGADLRAADADFVSRQLDKWGNFVNSEKASPTPAA